MGRAARRRLSNFLNIGSNIYQPPTSDWPLKVFPQKMKFNASGSYMKKNTPSSDTDLDRVEFSFLSRFEQKNILKVVDRSALISNGLACKRSRLAEASIYEACNGQTQPGSRYWAPLHALCSLIGLAMP